LTDHEKIVKLLNEKFNAMDFSKTERLEDGIWHLVDATGEMFVHFEGNVAKIRSVVDSIECEKSIDLFDNQSEGGT
jgi:hypothetical protein